MGEGFLGDMTKERRAVFWLLGGGLLLVMAGVDALGLIGCEFTEDGGTCASETNNDRLQFIFLLGSLCILAGVLLIQFSVLRTTGQNGEWLWFAFSITGTASLIYYFLDSIGSPLVKGTGA